MKAKTKTLLIFLRSSIGEVSYSQICESFNDMM